MAIKPILFNTEMVRAILDGRKTKTRRIAFKHDDLREFDSVTYPDGWWYMGRVFKSFDDFLHYQQSPRCMYAPGDILWVRETWSKIPFYVYKADDECPEFWDYDDRWHPSIHMPKEAARIFLRVKNVKVERLQDITPEQCVLEGVDDGYASREVGGEFVRGMFSDIWDSTIKKANLPHYGWEANPWVWVIEFERCEKPEGWCE